MRCDYVVIGSGLIGLSTAYHLLSRKPGCSVRILEKEPTLAFHQTSRTHGVLHAGVHCKPHTVAARLCVAGRQALVSFAQEHQIRHSLCGETIIASSSTQAQRLAQLQSQAEANGISTILLSRDELREREPFVAEGAGLFAPEAGVIDYLGVARALASTVERMGGEILVDAKLRAATRTGRGWILSGTFSTLHATCVVNCAGLHADTLARIFGDRTEVRIIPFRSEHFIIKDSSQPACSSPISLLSDDSVPWDGPQAVPHIDGSTMFASTPVLALDREGYSWSDCNVRDVARLLRFAGFRKLVTSRWRTSLHSLSPLCSSKVTVRELASLLPSIALNALEHRSSGVWARVVRPDGSFEQDLLVKSSPFVIHALNIPQTGATSCLAIGDELAQQAIRMS